MANRKLIETAIENYDWYNLLFRKLFLYKMREIWLTKSWLVDKALVTESTEIFWLVNSVLYDESRHGSPAGLSPYGLYLQVAPFADIE